MGEKSIFLIYLRKRSIDSSIFVKRHSILALVEIIKFVRYTHAINKNQYLQITESFCMSNNIVHQSNIIFHGLYIGMSNQELET